LRRKDRSHQARRPGTNYTDFGSFHKDSI